ncbi:MAG: PAQR family membrane homeostasis protein TrhA [Acutalibacteraceae bacterium]|jgi:hemolysin III
MNRTKLIDRKLPDYTKGEEIFNMVSHIVGGVLGVVIFALCLVKSFFNNDVYQIVGSFIYGLSMVVLYTISSIYHGLKNGTAKKVMQVIDHCAVFILIAGTYTPITLTSLREHNPYLGWGIFGFVWLVSAVAITFNAIDLKCYSTFSNICNLALGWCIILTGKSAIEAITPKGFLWILGGGLFYTVGAILYFIAGRKTVRYIHSVFHIFVVLGSLFQFIGILFYVLV